MDMRQLMKQAKKMQDEMQKKQHELELQTFEASAGGGVVTAVVNGKQELISLKINNELIGDDVDMLQDLVVAAVNEAIGKTKEAAQSILGNMMNGLPSF